MLFNINFCTFFYYNTFVYNSFSFGINSKFRLGFYCNVATWLRICYIGAYINIVTNNFSNKSIILILYKYITVAYVIDKRHIIMLAPMFYSEPHPIFCKYS